MPDAIPLICLRGDLDDIKVTLVFFSTFEELTLPIKGPMKDEGVIKL